MDFEKITLRQEISSRGGGIEIDLTTLGHPGQRMSAYQNYLGGGMLGRVCSDCTVRGWATDKPLSEAADQLRRHYHALTNPESDEWESTSYDQNQASAVSGY
jgi:hypothetical protein